MIEFHYEIDFEIKDSERTSEWIEQLIIEEGKEMGEITYIFCNDKFLLERNQKYLNHDTLTDIITFDYCEGDIISSDIMISIDRVKENSTIFENSFSDELKRVMSHGILHLIGYDDHNEKDKEIMREKENYYINKFVI
ncbi:MAG: rRNA maturation RNase YbeY [Flavobacteriales bacterium]|jgi:probable rRNA maturation factor|nr:rRNA maturation RNase YbeY [Flavobacteriales bacterium]MBT6808007.1 rRNA maturation RNase YbeY [Flavobacteriales bacterium]